MSTLTTTNITGVNNLTTNTVTTNTISVGNSSVNVSINSTAVYVGGAPAITATGGGTDQVFYLNGLTVNTSYTIPSGKSAHAVGPLTIANGVVIAIPAGSKFVVL